MPLIQSSFKVMLINSLPALEGSLAQWLHGSCRTLQLHSCSFLWGTVMFSHKLKSSPCSVSCNTGNHMDYLIVHLGEILCLFQVCDGIERKLWCISGPSVERSDNLSVENGHLRMWAILMHHLTYAALWQKEQPNLKRRSDKFELRGILYVPSALGQQLFYNSASQGEQSQQL